MLRTILMMTFLLLGPAWADTTPPTEATLYKNPSCTCCDGHADHLRANGYRVTVIETETLDAIKKKYSVPQAFEGCHTILVGGYVVEGHVPATIIRKLLKERPAITGIALPGMPAGSPGMGGRKSEPFVVYELSNGSPKVFATE